MACVSGNGHVNINNILVNKNKFICINSSRKDEQWSPNKIKMILAISSMMKKTITRARTKMHVCKEISWEVPAISGCTMYQFVCLELIP
jgi:hypothetical protein